MKDLFEFRYHRFVVPVDWETDNSGQITLVVREVLDAKTDHSSTEKPPILYLQGGPGFGSNLPSEEKWIKRLKKRFRVFLLDQRGTGLSTPIDLKMVVDLDLEDRDKAISFLTNFRADSIARDIEHIRKTLFADQKFYTFGQSFGGWCTLAYLSRYPNIASGCFITGGFAPLDKTPKDVYRAIISQLDRSNEIFLTQYPQTKQQLEDLIPKLDTQTTMLLAQCGYFSGYESSHLNLRVIIESLSFDLENLGRPSTRTLKLMYDPMSFISNPLYFLLHESIYCNEVSSNWAAEQVMLKENSRPDKTDLNKFFLGENVLSNTFERVEELKPLRGLMESIMDYSHWSGLFNIEKLQNSETPVVGTIYTNDVAVSTKYAKQCADTLGNGHYLESYLDHSAYKNHAEQIFELLFTAFDEL